MNRRAKRLLFYLFISLQVCWWVKVIFIDATPSKPSDNDLDPARASLRDTADDNADAAKTVDTLKIHLENVKQLYNNKNNNNHNTTNNNNNNNKNNNNNNNNNKNNSNNDNHSGNNIDLSQSDRDYLFKKYYNSFLRHTILPRNYSVIETGRYIKNPQTLCVRHAELDLLIIVHTSPYHFSRREFIRQTMANNILNPPYTVQPVFFLGVMPEAKRNSSNEALLEKEFQLHGDLVQMPFDEDFRNLSLKAVLWLRWTNEHCPNAFMYLKIDDDVVLDIVKVVPLSRALFSKYKRSIFCNVNKEGYQPIPRRGRTEVDMREFMGVINYPYTYCSGFIVFMTPDMLPLLQQTLTHRRVPFYNVDDVFMFGMIPKFTGHVVYHNLGFNVSIWHEKVYNCTVRDGAQCRYFGTMAENQAQREGVWQAMRKGHQNDFRFPQMTVK